MLDKAMRELDRERMGLQNQEKKLIAEIKKMAKEGQLVRLGSTCVGRTARAARGLRCARSAPHAQWRPARS